MVSQLVDSFVNGLCFLLNLVFFPFSNLQFPDLTDFFSKFKPALDLIRFIFPVDALVPILLAVLTYYLCKATFFLVFRAVKFFL